MPHGAVGGHLGLRRGDPRVAGADDAVYRRDRTRCRRRGRPTAWAPPTAVDLGRPPRPGTRTGRRRERSRPGRAGVHTATSSTPGGARGDARHEHGGGVRGAPAGDVARPPGGAAGRSRRSGRRPPRRNHSRGSCARGELAQARRGGVDGGAERLGHALGGRLRASSAGTRIARRGRPRRARACQGEQRGVALGADALQDGPRLGAVARVVRGLGAREGRARPKVVRREHPSIVG